MRIAYYAPTWPPSGAANGIVTYVAAMRRQLQQDGHEVFVVADGKLYDADDHGRDLAGQPGATLWDRFKRRVDHMRGEHPFAAHRLAGQLRRAHALRPFDVVEMEESFGWSGAAQRALQVPVVTRLHGPEFLKPASHATAGERARSRQRAVAEGRAIGRALAVSAPSSTTLQNTLSHYHHALAHSVVIGNPVPVDPDALHWRRHYEPGTILFVGRFDYLKGADTVLDAFARVAATRHDVRLIMVGPDAGLSLPGQAPIHFAEFVARFVPASLHGRIEFTGPVSPDRIAALRRRAALTIVASRCENLSYTVLEAMAVASPVICTAWTGSDEMIADGETGWLTPVGDAARLATRIAWVLDHPDIARRVGVAAWRHCRATYSPGVVARRSIEFYAEVVAGHARGR